MTNMHDGLKRKILTGVLAGVAAMLFCDFSHAADFLLFPDVTLSRGKNSADDVTSSEKMFSGSIFYSGDFGKLRTLAEAFISKEEREIERAQIGWHLQPDTSIWFGRFHNATGMWNTDFHHGKYLETTAERPRIVSFEDDGGVLPQHILGALLQHTRYSGNSAYLIDASAGIGPVLRDEGLKPTAVLGKRESGGTGITLRMSLLPDAAAEDKIGGFVTRTRIPLKASGFSGDAIQSVAGVYANFELQKWNFLEEAMYIHHRASGGASFASVGMWAGYAQAAYKINNWLSPYARIEAATPDANHPYLAMFPAYTRLGGVVGARVDLPYRQVVKLEYQGLRRNDETYDRKAVLQWSTVLP
jgi:hypothetical protein